MPSNSKLLRWLLILVAILVVVRLIAMIAMPLGVPMMGGSAPLNGIMAATMIVWNLVSMVLGALLLAALIVLLFRLIKRV
jgi:uncharacterized membrane protein